MKLKKSDFNAGSPYSCWLREEVCGEINASLHGQKNRGLLKKYHIKPDYDDTLYIMRHVKSLDDYPGGYYKVAVDIIRAELDENFLKKE